MSKLTNLKAELKSLGAEYAKIKTLPQQERKSFGEKLNQKKQQLLQQIAKAEEAEESAKVEPIDLTAPAAPNQPLPNMHQGSQHPLTAELDKIVDIFVRMGFDVMESHQLDDEFHMFESLNFPKDHPARDGYDTFRTEEGFIPPAHTSTMQHRALKKFKHSLVSAQSGSTPSSSDHSAKPSTSGAASSSSNTPSAAATTSGQIAVVIPGRVFRNEDVDATHEHTFYQCEGVYVSDNATMGQMLGILKRFLDLYYQQDLKIKTQPGYFPFTEPSLELLIEKPKALGGKGDGWLEMLGCGMIHPNVLKCAGIDPEKYTGFAWGGGIERLVMLKYQINDIRLFESAKLDFLTKF